MPMADVATMEGRAGATRRAADSTEVPTRRAAV